LLLLANKVEGRKVATGGIDSREFLHFKLNGKGGIRTLGNCEVTSVFKTDAIDHSATFPKNSFLHVEQIFVPGGRSQVECPRPERKTDRPSSFSFPLPSLPMPMNLLEKELTGSQVRRSSPAGSPFLRRTCFAGKSRPALSDPKG
jgi:hypothetical protein